MGMYVGGTLGEQAGRKEGSLPRVCSRGVERTRGQEWLGRNLSHLSLPRGRRHKRKEETKPKWPCSGLRTQGSPPVSPQPAGWGLAGGHPLPPLARCPQAVLF